MRRVRLSLALVCVAGACGAEPPAPDDGGAVKRPQEERPQQPSLLHLSLGKGASVLNELRSRGVRQEDFPERLPAARVDPSLHWPVRAVERFQVDGRPLLWGRPEGAFVDAARAGELARVDATRLAKGEERAVGRFEPVAVAALGEREVALFLLHSDAILTYAHIGSELDLVAERRTADGYEADLTGSHVYFTNERNEAPLSFTVRVAGDGAVTVRGR